MILASLSRVGQSGPVLGARLVHLVLFLLCLLGFVGLAGTMGLNVSLKFVRGVVIDLKMM